MSRTWLLIAFAVGCHHGGATPPPASTTGTTAQATPVACPDNGKLAATVGPTMLGQAPKGSDTRWSRPGVDLCAPILLPAPSWYVVAHVDQEIPDRVIRFHLAVDAATGKVVAASDPEQRSFKEACELKPGKIESSAVSLAQSCTDKMERSSASTLDATITPPKIVVREH